MSKNHAKVVRLLNKPDQEASSDNEKVEKLDEEREVNLSNVGRVDGKIRAYSLDFRANGRVGSQNYDEGSIGIIGRMDANGRAKRVL